MRNLHILSGAVFLALSASIATAGPWERDATSKALGDMQGRRAPRVNRAFSYAPATAITAPATAVEQPQATLPSAQQQDSSTRSFSYQAAPSPGGIQINRRVQRTPGFLRADRKALGDY